MLDRDQLILNIMKEAERVLDALDEVLSRNEGQKKIYKIKIFSLHK